MKRLIDTKTNGFLLVAPEPLTTIELNTLDKTPAYWIACATQTGLKTPEGHSVVEVEGKQLAYSQHDRIPPIGEEIDVYCNGWGIAKVVGYFREDGFFGILCTPKKTPKWYVEQNKRRKRPEPDWIGKGNIGVFGAEFDLILK